MEVIPFSNVEYSNQEEYQWNYETYPFEEWDGECTEAVNNLATRLEMELRAVKSTHFSSGEVLLPFGLLQNIARDVLAEAEQEPCGLRGCTLYLQFRGDGADGGRSDSSSSTTTLGTVKFNRATPTTFEIRLGLKQATAGWNSFLPQFLKKITRSATVMIDSDYKLEKNKLYRSCTE